MANRKYTNVYSRSVSMARAKVVGRKVGRAMKRAAITTVEFVVDVSPIVAAVYIGTQLGTIGGLVLLSSLDNQRNK